MNSSIQCLSNTYELTQYFLQKKYKSIIDKEFKNPSLKVDPAAYGQFVGQKKTSVVTFNGNHDN